MKIAITHTRNPLLGWDIDVKADGENGEKVTFVEVKVNGFPEVKDTPDEPLNSWERQLTQQGVFPGDNKVVVLVRDQNDDETSSEQAWA